MSEWIEMLNSTCQKKPDDVPEGFFTTKQLSEMTGKSTAATLKKIGALKLSGKVERKKFKVNNGRFVRPEFFYRIKK